MKMLPAFALALTLCVAAPVALCAADAPPAKTPAAKPAKSARMFGVWAKMSSLTPEQKAKIGTIHKQSLADKKAIEDKEDADIEALLTPEQKTELEKVKEDAAAAAKKKPAKAGEGATTQPADNGM